MEIARENAKTWQEKKSQELRMRWNSQRQPKIQMTESYLLVIILIVIAEIFASEALYFFIFDLDC